MNLIKFFTSRMNKKGFTLVELLLVIALLAVIGGIFVPRFIGTLDKAKENADKASAQNIAHQIELMIATGSLNRPTADGEILATVHNLDLDMPQSVTGDARRFVVYYDFEADANNDAIAVYADTDAAGAGIADFGTLLETIKIRKLGDLTD